jgi:hypothetical protein
LSPHAPLARLFTLTTMPTARAHLAAFRFLLFLPCVVESVLLPNTR